MPDLFSDITNAPSDVLQAIVKTLELRAADPQLQSMLESYLSEIELPDPARVLEIGSGTGAVARRLARLEQADRVVGLDPSPVFLAKARELAEGIDNLTFEEGDARFPSLYFFAFEVVRVDVAAIIILVILGLSGISRRPCLSSTRAESWCLFGTVGDCDPEAVKYVSGTTRGGVALPGR